MFSSNSGREWAEKAIRLIHAQLSDKNNTLTYDLIPCGHEIVEQLRQASDPLAESSEARYILERLESLSERKIENESSAGRPVSLSSRRFYADCRLLYSLLDLRELDSADTTEQRWEIAINRLDMAIVIAGAPGDGRLGLILDTVEAIQTEHLPLGNDTEAFFKSSGLETPLVTDGLAPNNIPRIIPPSIVSFRNMFSAPFIIPGFANDWPALTNHPWNSSSYLRQVSGRGRMVPVEVGSDYRAEEWSQKMIPWEAFLQSIGMNSDVHSDESKTNGDSCRHGDTGTQVLYLAQHSLLTQFPALRSDIIVPDYVYSSLPPPLNFPSYLPPDNDEQLVINAWLGPKGTLSPAHTDPYYNFYAQIVGRKTVWLAPPEFQEEMYPFLNPNAPHTTRSILNHESPDDDTLTSAQCTAPSLSNTSRVDVFTPITSKMTPFHLFESLVRPRALCSVLKPGDLLYIPPGWWHAMRSEDISFSVSMWF